MSAKFKGFCLGALLLGCSALCSLSAPDLQTTVVHNDTIFNDTNSVTKVQGNHNVKAVGYTFNTAEAATNSLTLTVTRIKTLIDRDNGTNAPAVLTWTNTHVIATILTTNTAGAIDTGSITDTFYIEEDDSITYTNTVVEDGILTIDWQY